MTKEVRKYFFFGENCEFVMSDQRICLKMEKKSVFSPPFPHQIPLGMNFLSLISMDFLATINDWDNFFLLFFKLYSCG